MTEHLAKEFTERLVAKLNGRDRRRLRSELEKHLRRGGDPEAFFRQLPRDLFDRSWAAAQEVLNEMERALAVSTADTESP